MTECKYRIYYDSAGLPKPELPLSADKVEHHLDCLPTDIRLYFSGKEVKLTTEPASSEAGGELYVALQSDELDDQELTSLIEDCVKRVNSRTSGLCFVIDREPRSKS